MANSEPDEPLDLHGVVDALRNNIDGEAATTGQRELAFAGLFIALFGIAAWAWLSLSQADGTPDRQFLEVAFVTTAANQRSNWVLNALQDSIESQLEANANVRVFPSNPVPERLAGVLLPGANTARQTPSSNDQWQLSIALTTAALGSASSDLITLHYQLTKPQPSGIDHIGEVTGKIDMLADLAARTSVRLRRHMTLSPPNSGQLQSSLAELPADTSAQQLLFTAREALRVQQYQQAVDQLLAARKLEGDHPLVSRDLARAYSGLGYEEHAQQYIALAQANSGTLSRERQLNIEAENHVLNQRWQPAGELLKALYLLYPTDIDYGLRLVAVQTADGKFETARTTLAQLRSLDGASLRDARIDLHAANVEHAAGDWATGLTHARSALEKAQQAGSIGIEAMALWWLNLLDDDRDESRINRAATLFAQTGNVDGQIAVLTRLGSRARARGDLAGADRHYTAAIRLAQASGNESRLVTALGTLAIVKDLQGQLREALTIKEQVLELRIRRGNQTGIGISLENLGISHYKMGEVTAARQRFEQANQQFERANDAIGTAWAPWHEGRLLVLEGKLAAAGAAFEAARKNAVEKPEGSYQHHVDYELLQLRVLQGMPPAEIPATIKQLQDLRNNYLAAELLPDAAITLLLQARVEGLAGNREAATKHALAAYETFAHEGASYYRLQAVTALVRLGQPGFCTELLSSAEQSEHRHTALIALAAAANCAGSSIDPNALATESRQLNLFEPLWLATHLTSPTTAHAMAQQAGWGLAP